MTFYCELVAIYLFLSLANSVLEWLKSGFYCELVKI